MTAMPYARYQDKLEAMRRYAQTPQGQAARARSHARYVAKRRAAKADNDINPAPLAQALKEWKQ